MYKLWKNCVFMVIKSGQTFPLHGYLKVILTKLCAKPTSFSRLIPNLIRKFSTSDLTLITTVDSNFIHSFHNSYY